MKDVLRLDPQAYTVRTCELEGGKITYREYRDLKYCSDPLDSIQRMNLFIPEAYYHGETISGYDKNSAPIFMPNTVGGYMPGPADEPGIDSHNGQINSIFRALEHGYVVASAGVRGRTSGKVSKEFFEGSKEGTLSEATGRLVGRAPAFIVDYKAAIRYLRHNQDQICGDTERIVTNGTSAGGALSALAGASGNSEDYSSYLEMIGAADERDDIFAASCYCPIHNLENADAAYEWLFNGVNDYHRTKHQRSENGIIRVPDEGMMSDEQIALSAKLKKLFSAYLNSLKLKDEKGNELKLDADGEGSFKDYLKLFIVASADKENKTHQIFDHLKYLYTPGSEIFDQEYLVKKGDTVTDLDWDAYVRKITRMKATPAFDALEMNSPENEEFGDENTDGRHFTDFSLAHTRIEGAQKADEKMIAMMNPVSFILNDHQWITKNWRIRHGAFDRDTSLAIPAILATLLKNRGFNVDFALPWGLPHSGDYDLDELFVWIDGLCKE